MGQVMSVGLTQHDVAELMSFTDGRFTQEEIEGLYKRFRQLDRGRKGFLTVDELNNIPELTINPLAKRISHMYEGVNFREFLGLLVPYSARATKEDRLRYIFNVYDVDGDGVVSVADLELMLRMIAGSVLSDEDLKEMVSVAFRQAGISPSSGMKFKDFQKALEEVSVDLSVEIPTSD